jgi:hypothetical protein
MNKYAFLSDSGRTELAGGSETVTLKAKLHKSRAYYGVDRRRTFPKDKSFSLVIRSEDGRTLLETRVEYMHQAFRKLIDWSIGDACHDGCAAISGPNGFYTNYQIKASRDFAWIESD